MDIRLFNTASRKLEVFEPLAGPKVSMYSCGMTVYYYSHIGHLRTYIMSDTVRRILEFEGYEVEHVMNVTDVGHMTSDEDEGEDKLEKRAREEEKSPWDIARYYEKHFFDSIQDVNILKPHVVCRATEHVPEMVELAERIEANGFGYKTDVGLIYDTGKFPKYAEFARLNLEGQLAGSRTTIDEERHNPSDFALWVSNQPNHIMQWDSPWGRGFPGWHLECSAMSMKYLGESIDIHTGGVDHIPVHHTNEIAQSEAATGKPFVKYWLHCAFLRIEGTKMSKSLGNLYTLDDLRERGFTPLSLRYFFMTSSYRADLDYSWKALAAAQTSLSRLWNRCVLQPEPAPEPDEKLIGAFREAYSVDLNMAKAISVVWEVADTDPTPATAATLLAMDRVLGLDLNKAQERLDELRDMQSANLGTEEEAAGLMAERSRLRREKKFEEADAVRGRIKELGFVVEDTQDGPVLRPLGPEV